MYTVKKTIEVSASHALKLSYPSKCSKLHGHNWIIEIYISAKELDQDGIVYDFALIKTKIMDKIDHQDLNSVLDFNPTAENIAKWISDELTDGVRVFCNKVIISESRNNVVIYERD